MGFKTIGTVLKMLISESKFMAKALFAPTYQNAKSIYNSIEYQRRLLSVTPHVLASAPDFTRLAGTHDSAPPRPGPYGPASSNAHPLDFALRYHAGPVPNLALILLDLKAAYRQFVVQFPFLNTYKTWNHETRTWRFTYSPLLMFGAMPSIYFFSVFPMALTMIFAYLGIPVTMYVDDLIIYTTVEAADIVLQLVTAMLSIIGLKLAEEKTQIVKTFTDPANALGYLYSIRSEGKYIIATLTEPKFKQVTDMLASAISAVRVPEQRLDFKELEKLVGNLVWTAQLDRYSPLRIITAFLKKWTIEPFFKRAVHHKGCRKKLMLLLATALDIMRFSPPQAIIQSDDYARGATHIFSDASLANNIAVFGAFVYVERTEPHIAKPLQFPAGRWYYYAKTIDISQCAELDRKLLTIEVFETLAVITLCYCKELIENRYLYANIDNSSSLYGIVATKTAQADIADPSAFFSVSREAPPPPPQQAIFAVQTSTELDEAEELYQTRASASTKPPNPVPAPRLIASLDLLKTFMSLKARPIIDYIRSAYNLGDAVTRGNSFFREAVEQLAAEQLDIPDAQLPLSYCYHTSPKNVPKTKTRQVWRPLFHI